LALCLKLCPLRESSFIIPCVCGRYRQSRRKQILEEHFLADWDELEWHPRYNIAPTQPVPIIRQNPKEPNREISLVRWGLIPSWTLLANSRLVGEGFELPLPPEPESGGYCAIEFVEFCCLQLIDIEPVGGLLFEGG
jgi:hypothetical protein